MCPRFLAGFALLLGGCLLLVAERSHGQRGDTPQQAVQPAGAAKPEVIAASVPVPNAAPAPVPGAIQQAAFVTDSPASGPPSSLPPPQSTTPVPMPAPVGPMEPSPAPEPPAPTPPAPTPAPAPFTPGAMFSKEPASAPPTAPSPNASPSAPPSAAAMVSVEVTGPPQMSLGQPLALEIVVRNTGSKAVAEVHVEEPLPAGVRALRSEPPAVTRDNGLTWNLGPLEAGAEKRLKVELQPTRPGELHLQPHVAFQSGDGLRTQVVQPPFSVEMTADRNKVVCGERVTFRVRVSNYGDMPVRKIKLYDTLPPGLRNPKNPNAKFVGTEIFGDLSPGESRSLTLETTAIQAGKFRNEIIAQADSGIEARSGLDVLVTEPSLSLRVDGPKQGVTQRDIDFRLELANPGPATAKRLRLVQALPPTFEAVAASTGANFDAAQHTLVWSLSDLAPNQRQVLTFRVKATATGDWPLYTAVLADNIPETRVANVLRIEGAAMLKLEVRARKEQLGVGDKTVYAMHVSNQGDALCSGVRLTADLPDEVTPLGVEGPVSGKIEKQQVRFEPLEKLPPRGEAVYHIHVRGRQAGKGHVHAELTADKQPSVQSEVSIQVNGGPSPPSGTQTVGHTNSTAGDNLR